MTEAQETVIQVRDYMDELDSEISRLSSINLSGKTINRIFDEFFPVTGDMSVIQQKNNRSQLDDLRRRYFDASGYMDGKPEL